VDRVEGRDNFMSRLPDLAGAELSTAITQIVAIDEERVMTMLEIKVLTSTLCRSRHRV
jgi:hypothetical protein